LKLDNKHVSRQQVKLSLNFATGLANVVSLGTNPTTVVRASGGELLLDANQLYAINPNDTICLWRAECRYRFVAQLKPGFSVPLLPDQPLVSDADAASNAKSKNGGIDGEDDDDDDDDDDDVSALVIGGAPPPPAVAPFTPPAPLRIDTVTNSIDDDEDDVNSRALTESETSASVSKQYSGAKGALAFVSPMRRGSSRLALQSTVPGGASSTASNAADAGASAATSASPPRPRAATTTTTGRWQCCTALCCGASSRRRAKLARCRRSWRTRTPPLTNWTAN
jgi:hypothetical protein